MTEAVVLRPDPGSALEATYRRVHATRMAGLPFLNERLAVEAVGFAPWKAHWLGALVTPWFMNLIVAPREEAQWRSLPPGEKRRYTFPAGDYDFISAAEEGVGEFFICSLFSPVTEFEDQETARFVANHALAALLDPANAAPTGEPKDKEGPIAQAQQKLVEPMSRRDLLRGRFSGRTGPEAPKPEGSSSEPAGPPQGRTGPEARKRGGSFDDPGR